MRNRSSRAPAISPPPEHEVTTPCCTPPPTPCAGNTKGTENDGFTG